MNWPQLKSGVRDLVADLTGLTGELAVEWAGKPKSGGFRPYPRATLSPVSMQSVGQDESFFEAAGADRVVTLRGQRLLTLQAKFETQGEGDPGQLADALRIRLRRESSGEALRALALSLSSVGPVRTFGPLRDDLVHLFAILEVTLLAVDIDIDTTAGAGDWFGEVIYDGEVRDTDESVIATIHEELP